MNCSQCGFKQPVVKQCCSNCGHQYLFTQEEMMLAVERAEGQNQIGRGKLLAIGLTAVVVVSGLSVILWRVSNAKEAPDLQASAVTIATPAPAPTETPAPSDSPGIQDAIQQETVKPDAGKAETKIPRRSRRYSARARSSGAGDSRSLSQVDKVTQPQRSEPVLAAPAATPTPKPRQDKKCLFGGQPIPCA